ncbi:phosphoribosylamine--glycine ligase [Deferribacter autotrophicus]|uniref:Phosphoribosylamine--glycine ligase n=1 Tax=Deferribacter autotrophicus TaxID=500465 RepID=A0A5A8F440_9BACT|nr:phosphoribosylamine--glycine ligase [Deferribacter autotrophicus]KAA0257310.1 phosphoribosylamine--glycine ligase [Deferribacter autotrophicus]
MKVLVIGSGGREHALSWKIAQSSLVEKVFVAPGNGGTAIEEKCENVDIKADDFNSLLKFAKNNNIDLTVVGPEDPLAKGIVDIFEENNLKIFGPKKAAAMIEASKAFAKNVMIKAGIPTAYYAEFSDFESAKFYVEEKGAPIVVKADGLAAGKGVTVAKTIDEAIKALEEIFIEKVFGESGNKVVIEEFLEGEEASYLAFTDGNVILPLVSSQDHKPIYDNDEGPNTGGMGAYSPAPVVTKDIFDFTTEKIAKPLINELANRGIKYKGIIYAGLMITENGPKVLEFNCRFGDPETQPVLYKMKSDIVPIILAAVDEQLKDASVEWYDDATVCVVLASGGYPKSYKKGYEITGINDAKNIDGIKVFHAGTKFENGKIITNGGRVLGVTGRASNLHEAIEKTYSAVKQIHFKDMHYRNDIGQKALRR